MYRAIGVFYSEPIYDQYSFYQNVTFDGINKVGNQKDFFKFILGIRNFTTLDGVADYYTIPTVSLTGDFEIECQFSLTDLTADMVLFGDGATGFDYLRIDPINGSLDIRYNNGFTSNDGQFTADNKLHTASLKRVGGTVFAYYDGVQVNSRSVSTSFTVEMLGSRLNNYLKGVLANIKITDGTDLIRYYKIDEDLSLGSTIIDSGSDGSNGTAISISSSELFTLEGADWIGAELVTNGNFATDSDWTKQAGWSISAGTAIQDGSDSFKRITSDTAITVVGYSYRKMIDIASFNTSNNDEIFERLIGNLGITYGAITGTGMFTTIGMSISTSGYLQNGALGTGGVINSVSVKRILQAP